MVAKLTALVFGLSIICVAFPVAAEEYCDQSNSVCLDYQTQPVTLVWHGVGDLNDVARRACIKMFGGASSLESVNIQRGIVLCRTSQGRLLDRLRLKRSAKRHDQEPRSGGDALPGTDQNEAQKCVGEACKLDERPDERSKVEVPAHSEGSSRKLQDQAQAFCVQRLGPTASVDHIDFNNWRITCKK